jgi:putative transposase
MDERIKFMLMHEEDGWSMTDLCAMFGVSRKTGYKWRTRYAEVGMEGLRAQSRAPRRHPNAVAADIEAAIVELKTQRLKRGPKKLLEMLRQRQPGVHWPARSTIAAILKRHGLVPPRGRSRKTPPL